MNIQSASQKGKYGYGKREKSLFINEIMLLGSKTG